MSFVDLHKILPLNSTFIPFEKKQPNGILKESLESEATSALKFHPIVECILHELKRFKNKSSFQYVDITFQYVFNGETSMDHHCKIKLSRKFLKHVFRGACRIISHFVHSTRNTLIGMNEDIIQVDSTTMSLASIKLSKVTMYRTFRRGSSKELR